MHSKAVIAWMLVAVGGSAVGVAQESSNQPDHIALQNWPQFRGSFARGVLEGKDTPTQWDGKTGSNVKWKTLIPGLGHSAPIIWGDKVFVTTCVSENAEPKLRVGLYGDIVPVDEPSKHSWLLYCLDKKDGSILWKQTAHEGVPAIKRHPKSSHANCTPATDGKHVVAFFGSEGLYCYDLDGKLLWKKDLGVLDAGYWKMPEAQWSYGSSPIIHDGKVFVQCDVQQKPFLAAFDVHDGKELWRTPHREVCTWSTPTIHQGPDRVELIANGFWHIGGFDPATGKELWKLGGGSDIPVPTPFVADGLIFITSSHRGPHPLFAIRLGATGDISLKDGETSNEYVAWYHKGRGTYMQTPIVYGDLLYTCRDNGVMTSYIAKTGEQVYRRRLGLGQAGFTASPVASKGKIYFTSEEGDTFVIKAGRQPELLSTNSIGELCMATPAISDGMLFIRARHHLFCIGE